MVEPDPRTHRTSGMNTWRARCGGSRTPGSEGGPEKPTSRKARRALRSDPYTSREVFFAGITANPTGPWTTQQARNLFLRHADRLTGAKALVRDRGSQFIDPFDEVFRTEGFKILKTPIRTPVANAFAERWIGSLRRELLDRTLIWNRRHLERLVTDYIAHYNEHRPHRSLHQRPPLADENGAGDTPPLPIQVIRTTRCNGLIHEYQNAA